MALNYTTDMAFTSLGDSFKKQAWLKDHVGVQKEAWHLTSPDVDVQRWSFAQEADLIVFELKWI